MFFEQTATLFDYLPASALLVMTDNALDGLDEGWELIAARYEQMRHDKERPVLEPQKAFYPAIEMRDAINDRRHVKLSNAAADGGRVVTAETALDPGEVVCRPQRRRMALSEHSLHAGERLLMKRQRFFGPPAIANDRCQFVDVEQGVRVVHAQVSACEIRRLAGELFGLFLSIELSQKEAEVACRGECQS